MKIQMSSSIMRDSIVDGEGLRTVIWTQGCPRRCLGCHNPETWSIKKGFTKTTDEILEELKISNEGITFSGGDPFMQSEACAIIAKELKKRHKNIWVYTGYLYEDLIELGQKEKSIMDFLQSIDVLVDGPFLVGLKSLECPFRGSKNQRIINVPMSLKKKKVVEIAKYKVNFSNHIKPQEKVYI